MFDFGSNSRQAGMLAIKAAAAQVQTFEEVELVLFGLIRMRHKFDCTQCLARLDNLITQAQRKRRELGNTGAWGCQR